jgi:hypothetical protein
MRRSAAKALRCTAGVPESVIMSVGGWRTGSKFRRYAILSSADQRDAMEKLEWAHAEHNEISFPPPAMKSGGDSNWQPN